MAAAALGMFNQQLTAGQALTGQGATPMANAATGTGGSSSTSSSSSSSATISANDFLTLLVTEMQNQDPTADTDPNEYINQLVQVNSLEQLISINQTLSTALGGTNSSSSASTNSTPAGASTSSETGASPAAAAAQGLAAVHKASALNAAQPAASNAATVYDQAAHAARHMRVPGNLSVPEAQPAALRVAHALDGHSHSQSMATRLPGAQ